MATPAVEMKEVSALRKRWLRYPRYKDSGVEWLGEVPEQWDVRKLRFISRVELSTVDKKKTENEELVHLCNYVDVYYNNCITENLDFMEGTATFSEIYKFSLKKGDILITKDSEDWDDIAVPAYVSRDLKNVVCGYHLAQIRPNEQFMSGEYVFRSFQSSGIGDQFKVAANGITRYGISKIRLLNSLFLVPPLPEQHAIAAFLDRETARIDALIEKKKRQIELLQEKRAALISHAVTKGLDPNAKMKDSGVEWLGEVPEHWEVTKFGYHAKFTNGINFHGFETGFTYGMIGVGDFKDNFSPDPEITTIELKYPLSESELLQEEDLIFVRSNGNPKLVGRCLFIDKLNNSTTFSGFTIRSRIGNSRLYPKFFAFFFSSDNYRKQIESLAFGTNISNISQDFLSGLKIPLPPLKEQKKITRRLISESLKIKRIIFRINKSIDELKEYRSALISAAVTGKIDVRQVVSV